jgi:hypothetical protein
MTFFKRNFPFAGLWSCFGGEVPGRRVLLAVFVGALLHSVPSGAQSFSSSAVTSAGSSATNGGLSVDWTLGETAVSAFGTASTRITEGVQQPVIITMLAADQQPVGYTLDVFPNPSSATVTVRLLSDAQDRFTMDLVDVRGISLLHRETETKSASVNFDIRELVPATYFLRIAKNGAAIVSLYKIVKVQ